MREFVFLIAFLYAGISQAQVTLTNPPYQENFDNIASGLPAGFFVQTGSTATAAGTEATYTPAKTFWGIKNPGFYNCASATGLRPTAFSFEQDQSTNRALSVRQTASYGNPGAAFVFKLVNTSSKTNFQLAFKMVSLDSSSQAVTSWRVDYGVGANPSAFTQAVTNPVNIRTGAVSTVTTSGYQFITNVTVNFGTALDDKSDNVWIRVWAPVSTTLTSVLGNGIPTMSGIDDWNLSWTNSPSTNINELNKAGNNIVVSGFQSNNSLRVDFKNAVKSTTIIRLTDINGAVLWEKQYPRIQANQTEWIRPGSLNKGIYILQIQNSEGRLTRRIAN